MAIFGAQGIRDAMANSYHKHVADLAGRPLPAGTTLYQAALYGALGTRYMTGFKSVPEVVIWAELAPFLNLPPGEEISALAEYVVYKEMPAKADVPTLSGAVRRGWALLDKDQSEALRAMAEINGLAWLALL